MFFYPPTLSVFDFYPSSPDLCVILVSPIYSLSSNLLISILVLLPVPLIIFCVTFAMLLGLPPSLLPCMFDSIFTLVYCILDAALAPALMPPLMPASGFALLPLPGWALLFGNPLRFLCYLRFAMPRYTERNLMFA